MNLEEAEATEVRDARHEALLFAQTQQSQQLVAAQLNEVRQSWRVRSMRQQEQFRSSRQPSLGESSFQSYCSSFADPSFDVDRANKGFEDFVVETMTTVMLTQLQRGKKLDATYTVVALSELLNECFFAVVRGTNAQLTTVFEAFEPHSPVCVIFYVLDASMGVMDLLLADDEARSAIEGLKKGKAKAIRAALDVALRKGLTAFTQDNQYDPFGHFCEEDSLRDLREDDAQNPLEPLFEISAPQ